MDLRGGFPAIITMTFSRSLQEVQSISGLAFGNFPANLFSSWFHLSYQCWEACLPQRTKAPFPGQPGPHAALEWLPATAGLEARLVGSLSARCGAQKGTESPPSGGLPNLVVFLPPSCLCPRFPTLGLPWWLSWSRICSAGDLDSIPGWGRSPGNGDPLQYSDLENRKESDRTERLLFSTLTPILWCSPPDSLPFTQCFSPSWRLMKERFPKDVSLTAFSLLGPASIPRSILFVKHEVLWCSVMTWGVEESAKRERVYVYPELMHFAGEQKWTALLGNYTPEKIHM